MLGKWHATARCNYNTPSFLHLSFYLPSLPSLSLSLLLSAISAAVIAAKFYRVSHLNRQNISPGIQPQWAACLPPISLSRREALSGWKIANHWGGWRTERHRQISICYTNTCFSSSTMGVQKALDLIHCCWGKKGKRYPCYVLMYLSMLYVCVVQNW